MPTVQPGYIRQMIPDQAPEKGESWEAIFQDVERVIMPGVMLLFKLLICDVIKF